MKQGGLYSLPLARYNNVETITMTVEEFKCNNCGEFKPADGFSYQKRKSGHLYRRLECKKCYSDKQRLRMQDPEHRDKVNARRRERQQDPTNKAKATASTKKWRDKKKQDPKYRDQVNAKKRESEKKRRQNPQYRSEYNAKQRERAKKRKDKNPFVVYALEFLTGKYKGWFYIGQTVNFPERLRNHKRKTSTISEIRTALKGRRGVSWNVEFLEEHQDKPTKTQAAKLESHWILKYIQDGKKLLNRQIPEEAVRVLFERET